MSCMLPSNLGVHHPDASDVQSQVRKEIMLVACSRRSLSAGVFYFVQEFHVAFLAEYAGQSLLLERCSFVPALRRPGRGTHAIHPSRASEH